MTDYSRKSYNYDLLNGAIFNDFEQHLTQLYFDAEYLING